MTNCGNCGRPLGDAFERGECAYPLGVTCVEAARKRPAHGALRRELADAKAEVERLRNQLQQHDDGVAGFIRWTGLQREADCLRRLAWEWCIEAKRWSDAAVIRADWQEWPPIESLGPVPVRADQAADLSDGYSVGAARDARVLAWLIRDAVRRGCEVGRGRVMAFEYTTGCEHGRADERRNIVAALRRKARAHERLSGLRCSPALRQWWDWDLARYHEGAADALEAMADSIERGET